MIENHLLYSLLFRTILLSMAISPTVPHQISRNKMAAIPTKEQQRREDGIKLKVRTLDARRLRYRCGAPGHGGAARMASVRTADSY